MLLLFLDFFIKILIYSRLVKAQIFAILHSGKIFIQLVKILKIGQSDLKFILAN